MSHSKSLHVWCDIARQDDGNGFDAMFDLEELIDYLPLTSIIHCYGCFSIKDTNNILRQVMDTSKGDGPRCTRLRTAEEESRLNWENVIPAVIKCGGMREEGR